MYSSRLKFFFIFIILLAVISFAAYFIFPKLKNQNQNTQLALVDLSRLDSDSDGLSDKKEEDLGTNLYNSDSDSDGYSDLEEVKSNHNPLLVESGNLLDDDGDGLTNEDEQKYGTNPKNADSDYDGFADGIEIVQGYEPTKTNLSAIKQVTSSDASALSSVQSLENTLNANDFGKIETNLDALLAGKVEKKDYNFSSDLPEISDSAIKTGGESNKESVKAYVNSLGILFLKALPSNIDSGTQLQSYILSIDPQDPQDAKQNIEIFDKIYTSISNLEVPNDPEIIAWHKKLLSVLLKAKELSLRWEEVRDDVYGITKLFQQVQALNSYCTDVLGPEFDRLLQKYDININKEIETFTQFLR